jgi:hypothetical protein
MVNATAFHTTAAAATTTTTNNNNNNRTSANIATVLLEPV